MRAFCPLVPSGHLLTVAANFWPRRLDETRYPVEARLYRSEPDVQVLVHAQRPSGGPLADILAVHGLEGSSQAGYMRSLAQAGLEAGLAVHRLNLRGCGDTEHLCRTLYHSGLTSDVLAVVRELGRPRVFLAGFSLGGNVVLKLAGELGERACGLIAGVCAVSTPIDLAACVRRLSEPRNRLYEWRFLLTMKRRMRRRHRLMPQYFSIDGLERVCSVYEFDDRITGPAFGFRGADEYYETQSAVRFLDGIRVPTLLIQAQDDPLVPFEVFHHPAVANNAHIELLATEHGGHVGFLSRRRPRFWLDQVIVEWIRKQIAV